MPRAHDNARATLSLLVAATVLNDDTWDPALLRCMLGNFRSTGPDGFRNPRIDSPEFNVHDWKWFWKQSARRWSGTKYSPHYQAYQWAVNLWIYDKTRFEHQSLLPTLRIPPRIRVEFASLADSFPRMSGETAGRR